MADSTSSRGADARSSGDARGIPAAVGRASVAVVAVAVACTAAWPFLPRSYDATAEVALLPAEGGIEGAPRVLPDDAAVQTEVDRMTSGTVLTAVAAGASPEVIAELSRPRPLDRALGRLASIAGRPSEPMPDPGPAALARRIAARMSAVRERHGDTIALTATAGSPTVAVALASAAVDAYLAENVRRKRDAIEAEAARHAARVRAMARVAALSREAARSFGMTSPDGALPGPQEERGDARGNPDRSVAPASDPRRPAPASLLRRIDAPSRADEAMVRQSRDEARLRDLERAAAVDEAALAEATLKSEADLGRTAALRPDAELITPPVAGPRPTRPEPGYALAGGLMAAMLAGALAAIRPWRRGGAS